MDRTRNPVFRVLIHAALLLWMLYSITPFMWSLVNSLKLPRDLIARTPKIFPTATSTENMGDYNFVPTGRNYSELWLNVPPEQFQPVAFGLIALTIVLVGVGFQARRFPVPPSAVYMGIVAVVVGVIAALPNFVDMAEFYGYFLNSILVTVATVVISISVGCLAGYALSRYTGILGVIILFTALAFRALPRLAFILPYYYLAQATGLYDTRLLLVITLVAINQPFAIWMLRSFFMDIPKEIEEAAMIDGCSRLQSFVRVIIPIMWPGIITTALFTLLLAYNEFLLPRILMQQNWTLPVAIVQYTSGEDASYVTLAAAGSVSITLPIVVVIIFFQKYLIKGLAFGAVKG